MTGILFGTGIGPGDPELMTLKAVRLIRENDTIAVPGEKPEESIAYQIAVQAVPELAEKELVAIPMPMTKNAKELEENHRRGAEKIEELLDAGKNVVFLTLGDPTVYSTYLYVHRRVLEDGYDARIVSGVTSFCAAAASLSEGLVENSEELHVIPASYQIEDALEFSGTKVLMKAGKKMPAVKQFLKEKNCRAVMVENCGMDTEQKYFSAEEIPDQASYYSLIIVKEKRKKYMVHFIGAGPGAPDLITVRGQKLLGEADIIIYAGSLVNPALLDLKKEGCVVYNSATMTLEQVIDVMKEAESKGQTVARLHTGDPCLYGAIREQIDALDALGIAHDDCPGVSSFCGAAAALEMEYTLPDISQSVVITRMAGRTPVPERESIASFAAHQATMVVFLSTGLLEELSRELIAGGYTADTPAAIVYKATWPEEKTFVCTVGTLAETAKKNQITKTALMIIGNAVSQGNYRRSDLYNPAFTTEFREAEK